MADLAGLPLGLGLMCLRCVCVCVCVWFVLFCCHCALWTGAGLPSSTTFCYVLAEDSVEHAVCRLGYLYRCVFPSSGWNPTNLMKIRFGQPTVKKNIGFLLQSHKSNFFFDAYFQPTTTTTTTKTTTYHI